MHAVVTRRLQLLFNLLGNVQGGLVDSLQHSGARQPSQAGAATR